MEWHGSNRESPISAETLLSDMDSIYMACRSCPPDPNFNKNAPFKDLPEGVSRCKSCSKTPLDAVMLHALQILVDEGLRDERSNLRSVGSPLVSLGFPMAYSPRIGKNDLIIAGGNLDRKAARKMIECIPEIKGVILMDGTPGIRDSLSNARENILLAGSDLRADVISSLFGDLVIFKNQASIHIEFSRSHLPKMKILEALYFEGKIRDVVDGLCGPGTLGLMCVLAGAKRVVLNDAWLPAIKNVVMNLQSNRNLLGIDSIEYPEKTRTIVGGDPVLVAKASGRCEISVYHGDLIKLFSRSSPGETCLIDHFPGADISKMMNSCKCCSETVIV